MIDLAVGACVAHGAGTPQNYADAFRRLQQAAVIEPGRADRLVRAAGFRNVVAQARDRVRYGDAWIARPSPPSCALSGRPDGHEIEGQPTATVEVRLP